MARLIEIYPAHPQPRRIQEVVSGLRRGNVIAYPTDSTYALGCQLEDKAAVERLRRLRGLGERHHLTLMCQDLSQISTYARLDNSAFRLLKALTPGPYTFILPATREVPRRLQHPQRKTVGLRVPDHPVAQALPAALGEPLLSTSLILPAEAWALTDASQIRDMLGSQLDLVVDGGACGREPTTVIDLTRGEPEVIRQGRGDTRFLER